MISLQRLNIRTQTLGLGRFPSHRVFQGFIGFLDVGLFDCPVAPNSGLASRDLKVAHGDSHIHALKVCEVEQPEDKAPLPITFRPLKEEMPRVSDSDDSPRLFV